MTFHNPREAQPVPSSPPPSFRSRASSFTLRHLLSSEDPVTTEAERTLNETFDDGSDSDDDDSNGSDDRQRLMRSNTAASTGESRQVHDGGRPIMQETSSQSTNLQSPAVAEVPRPYTGNTPYASFSHSNDGVFANLNAKPERGEKTEEQPPVSEIYNDTIRAFLLIKVSPTKQQQRTQRPHTGKQQSSPPATSHLQMKSTSTAFP